MPVAPPSGFNPNPDVANEASKLPRPLQQPVGTALGILKQFTGGDDPNARALNEMMPMMGNVVWAGDAAKAAAPEASGALHALWNAAKNRLSPAAETLGETAVEHTPVGGEGLFNTARNGLRQLADPVENAYHRIMTALPTSK